MTATEVPYKVPEELNDPNGEIILRSSDQVEFRVFRWPLQRLYPVFFDMFNLPDSGAPSSPKTSAQPVVQMDETAPVVEALLRLSYPIDPPIVEDLGTMVLITEAIVKLQAERGCRRWIRMTVENIVHVNPWAMYAILLALGREGYNYNFEEEIRIAARATVGWKILRPWKEASMITAADYDRLLIFHLECKNAFLKALDKGLAKAKLGYPGNSHCSKVNLKVGKSYYQVARWFVDFRAKAREKFCGELRGEAVEDVSLWYEPLERDRMAGVLCFQCAKDSTLRMPEYTKELSKLMEEIISQVSDLFWLSRRFVG